MPVGGLVGTGRRAGSLPSRIMAVLVLVIALATSQSSSPLVSPAAAAAATGANASTFVFERASDRDAERARDVAGRDDRVRERLALRRGDYDVHVDRVLGPPGMGDGWRVRYDQESRNRLEVFVADDFSHVTRVTGQSQVVMPSRVPLNSRSMARLTAWLPLTVIFTACLLLRGGPARRTLLIAAPLLVLVGAFVVTVSSVLTLNTVFIGNLLLLGAANLAMLAGATTWLLLARSTEPGVAGPPLLPAAAWFALALGAVATVIAFAWRLPLLVDVGYASDAGARLMIGGSTVYGHIDDVPGFLARGDTYGPAGYLAYVPAALELDDTRLTIMVTNLALVALVAVQLLMFGARTVDLRTGAWAAATWLSCPFVVLNAVSGNNDIIVGAAMSSLAVLLGRPGGRGCVVALAASAKFLPILALAAVLRRAGEARGAILQVILGCGMTMGVLFGIGLHGGTEFAAFWDATVRFQTGRDDLASVSGMLGAPWMRVITWAAALAAAAWSVRLVRRGTDRAPLLCAAAILALVLAALPQYWASYGTWFLPLVIAAEIVSGRTSPPIAGDAA